MTNLFLVILTCGYITVSDGQYHSTVSVSLQTGYTEAKKTQTVMNSLNSTCNSSIYEYNPFRDKFDRAQD